MKICEKCGKETAEDFSPGSNGQRITKGAMEIIICTIQDVKQLAVMNRRLIEDEQSANPMNLIELEERMKGFLEGEYDAYFFREEGNIVGYALIRNTSDPLYLRQFFIEREYRRRHYGRKAFEELIKYLQVNTITVDVLPWNERGMAFWKSLGFSETHISMKYER